MLLKSALLLASKALPCCFLSQMEFLCEHQQIRVLLDGRQLCDFTHRIQPLNLVKALQITGDVKLTKVAWMNSDHNINMGQRKMYFPLSTSWLILLNWNCLFHLLICLKYTFFFFLIHAQKLQIWLVQIDQRASAEVLCQYLKLQDLWCYAVSSIFVVPSCPRHGAQSFVVAWLLPLSLELGTVQVLRMRKGNWDTSLWVNKRVWRAPMSLRLSGENCLSGKLCSINMSSMCFLVGSNKCLTTIPVSCR